MPSNSSRSEDWAVCTICHEVISQATLSGCDAEHIFCRACIDQVEDFGRCPTCRAICDARNRKESVFANRLIQNFDIKCKNKPFGCAWIGPLSNLDGHQSSCSSRPQPCPRSADGCEFQGTAAMLTEHASDCGYTILNCSRQCGVTYKRRQQKDHERACNGWPCTVTPGCRTKTTLRFLKKHEGFCKQQAEQLAATKKRLANVKAQLRRQKKTEAKRAAKENGVSAEEGGDPDADDAKLIPTAHDTPSKGSTKVESPVI